MNRNAQWKLADAKNRFSELVNRALSEGPQTVHRRDETVVVINQKDYEQLSGARADFKEFLMGKGPSLERVDLKRDRSPMRAVKL
jgi:antitoxin Phd